MTLTSERIEVPSDSRALLEMSLAERWGDGLPILPATDDVIEALLGESPYPADYALCVLPPVNGVATVELIAINAAMAGVEPAAFPYVLAALEAITEPEWNAFGLTTTTSSVFPMLLVNGNEDKQVPIEDFYLLLEHGDPKAMRLFSGGHMGAIDNIFQTVIHWLHTKLD